jgi:hypothetical protein
MQWFRNMEGVVMLSFGVVCAAAFAGSPAAPAGAPQAGAQTSAGPAPAMVVVVTGKRMTAAEKRAFDLQARS